MLVFTTASPFDFLTPKTTAQETPTPNLGPCGDEFSTSIRNDIILRLSKTGSSLVLDPYLGDESLIFNTQGLCRSRTEDPESASFTLVEFGQKLINEMKAEAEKNNFKLLYSSNSTEVLNGHVTALIFAPPPERVALQGSDFRVLTIFVFNNTRLVGAQMFVSVTGLKTP